MPHDKDPDQDDDTEDYLSPEDIRQWAERETRNARRALDLKVKELSSLVTAYSAGEMTPEQADEAHSRYYHRWGESLGGIVASESVADDAIVALIDEARPFKTPRQLKEEYSRHFKNERSR